MAHPARFEREASTFGRVALYPAQLRVPETRNYSALITPVDDALKRSKRVRVADHPMAFAASAPTPGFPPRWLQCGCNASLSTPIQKRLYL
jgi:hypothetical protein